MYLEQIVNYIIQKFVEKTCIYNSFTSLGIFQFVNEFTYFHDNSIIFLDNPQRIFNLKYNRVTSAR